VVEDITLVTAPVFLKTMLHTVRNALAMTHKQMHAMEKLVQVGLVVYTQFYTFSSVWIIIQEVYLPLPMQIVWFKVQLDLTLWYVKSALPKMCLFQNEKFDCL